MKWGCVPQDWKIKQVAEIADVLLSNVAFCNYMDVIKNDYIDSSIDFMEATATVQEINKFHLKKDDVIITRDSETEEDIAQSSVVTEDLNGVLCGYHLAILRPRHSDIVGKYLMNSIKSKNVHKYFVRLVNGVTRFGLNKSSISSAFIPTPPLPEQQKIAEILNTIDDKITSIEDCIQQTEQLKKGLMEKLLTEGIGHKVFEITESGRKPASWDLKKLNEVSRIIDSLHKTPEFSPMGMPMVRVADIQGGNLDLSKTNKVAMDIFDEFTKKYLPVRGDIVFSRVGSYGKISYVNTDNPFCLG